MRNYRIGGILIMLLGMVIYFFAEPAWENFAGAIVGAGLGLFLFSFLRKAGNII